MIVLKTKDEWKHGQTNTVPHLGTIKIGEDGLIHVEDIHLEKAQKLVDCGINFVFHGEDEVEDLIEPQTNDGEEDLSKKKEEDKVKPQVKEVEILDESGFNAEKVKMVTVIQESTSAELQTLCTEMGFPKKDWITLKKADLKRYIIRKL